MFRNWLKLLVSFPAVTLSNHLPRRKDARLPNGGKRIWNEFCGKNYIISFKKVLKRQFQKCSNNKKVLIRQFQKCLNNNFYKTLKFSRKSFYNILDAEWHLLPLEKTKIINSSLYEQKNHFSYPFSVADGSNFSCICATENMHDQHLPVSFGEGHV